MPLTDSTDKMNTLRKSGPADVKLSEAARDKYVKIIADLRGAFEAEQRRIVGAEGFGNAGTFLSADQTKRNLTANITGSRGLQRAIDDYIGFLDAFETAVKKSCDRLIEAG